MEEQQRIENATEATNIALVVTQTKKRENQNKQRPITNTAKKEWSNEKKCDNCKKAGHTM